MHLLVAHQGGWDEIMLVAAPVFVIAGLFALANSRAKRLAEDQNSGPDEDVSDTPGQ